MNGILHTLHFVLAGTWLGGVVFTMLVVSPALKAMKWPEPERVLVRSRIGRQYAKVGSANLVLLSLFALLDGRAAGFVSGLGAAAADALYGAIAGFGLTLVSVFLVQQQGWLRLVGGSFLCYLGAKTLLARPADEAAADGNKGGSLPVAYASTFFLTLTNPVTILSFAAIFAGMGAGAGSGGGASAALLVAGVFLGSALWWLLLSMGAGLLRGKVGARGMIAGFARLRA